MASSVLGLNFFLPKNLPILNPFLEHYPNWHALCFTVLVKEIRMLLHKILKTIAQLCSDSTKGSTFCCIQRLLMMSLHVYVTLLNKKILTCLLGKKEMKTSRGNSGPKTQCCCCDLENPFFKKFQWNYSKFCQFWNSSNLATILIHTRWLRNEQL